MKYRLLRGVVLGMACAMPLAQAKQYQKAPAELETWPLPWARGVSLDYDRSSESVLEVKGTGNRIQTEGVLRIKVERAGADGFVQSWVSLGSRTRYLKVSDPSQLLLQDMAASLAAMPLQVRLSAEGHYSGIANLDEVQSRFSAMVKPRFDKLLESGRQPISAGIRSGLKNVFSAYSAGPVLEMQLSVLPSAYNFMGEGGIGLDYEYKYEDLGASPLGGEPFPMTGRFTLRKDELHEGWLLMEWSTGVDREKGGPLLAELARKLLGEAFIADGGKQMQDQIAQMADSIDVGTSSRFRLDPSTGIVQWMQLVQRKRIGDRNDVHTTTLALRSEKYIGARTDPIDEPASVLIQACSDTRASGDAVIAACSALLQIESEDDSLAVIGHFHRGRGHDKKMEYDSAILDFGEAIKLDPSHAMSFLYRGAVHGKRNELDAAVADLDQAIALSPDNGPMYLERGFAREARKEYPLALRDYGRAVDLLPREASAWGARCWLRAISGAELQSALADCDQAIALDATPANANAFNSRGFVNFMMGRCTQSIRDYDSAIAGDPRVASSYYMRGLAKARSGDPSAEADKAAGIKLEPEVAKRYATYGVANETKAEIPQ